MLTKILFSFGTQKYYPLLDNLEKSAKEKGNTDKIILLKESDIHPKFYEENNKIFSNKRGFGYWIWKSYFINNFLKNADKNEIFFYIDAGHVVLNDLTPLYDICNREEKGVVLFENTDGEPHGDVWKNNLWTKSDCFNLMGFTSDEYVSGDQVNASYILFRKTEFSIKFFEVYLNFCKNYNIISDAPNITENFNKDFRDHRHDQSILSLLSIHHKILILRDPSQFGNHRMKNREYGQLFYHYRIP